MLKNLPLPSVSGLSSRSRKHVGLPPGAVVFTGRDTTTPIQIDVMSYTDERFDEASDVSIDTAFSHRDRPGPSWINVSRLTPRLRSPCRPPPSAAQPNGW